MTRIRALDGPDPGVGWPGSGGWMARIRGVPGPWVAWSQGPGGPGSPDPDPPGPPAQGHLGGPGPGSYPTLTPDDPGVIRVTGRDRPNIRERCRRSCPRGQLRAVPEPGPEPRARFLRAARCRVPVVRTGHLVVAVYPGCCAPWVRNGMGFGATRPLLAGYRPPPPYPSRRCPRERGLPPPLFSFRAACAALLSRNC